MDILSQVEVTRLHTKHLRMLIDQLLAEIRLLECLLASQGALSSALGTTQLKTLEKQSEHLAKETVRLQGFVHSLTAKDTDVSEAATESTSLPADAPKESILV